MQNLGKNANRSIKENGVPFRMSESLASLRKFLDNSGLFHSGMRNAEKGGKEERKNGSAELEHECAGVKKEENITAVTITRAGAPAGSGRR